MLGISSRNPTACTLEQLTTSYLGRMAELIIPIALVAVVLMLSGLISGVMREAPLSLPIVFLNIGLVPGQGRRA